MLFRSNEDGTLTQHVEGNVTVLDDWEAEHVAFVDRGAFENVEVVDWWQGDTAQWYRLRAELVDSHNLIDVTDGAGTRLVSRQPADVTKIEGETSLENENVSPDLQSTNESEEDFEVEIHEDYLGEELQGKDLSYKDRSKMPKSQFAYVDKDGKGHLPINDASHVRAALSAVKNWAFRGKTLSIPRSARAAILRKVCAAARRFGVESELCGNKKGSGGTTTLTTETQTNEKPPCEGKVESYEAEVQRLKGELAQRDQKIEILTKNATEPSDARLKAELDRVSGELNEVKAWRAEKLNHELMAKVDQLVNLRIEAGLSGEGDRIAEVEKYKVLSAEALDPMIKDFEIIVSQVRSGGPKAKPAESGGQILRPEVRQHGRRPSARTDGPLP